MVEKVCIKLTKGTSQRYELGLLHKCKQVNSFENNENVSRNTEKWTEKFLGKRKLDKNQQYVNFIQLFL